MQSRYSDCVFALERLLENYRHRFPEFTDHTINHALDVMEFCNIIIAENIYRLNADEIYVLLMGTLTHDVGMGVNDNDYISFMDLLGLKTDIDDKSKVARNIRLLHNELSGQFLKKYADFLEIPCEDYLFAIIQVARGHRKTNLFDENEYPCAYKIRSTGNSVCLPYLAALVRLADEIDITAERNPALLYNIADLKTPKDIFELKKHLAVKSLGITDDSFIINAEAEDSDLYCGITDLYGRIVKTFNECSLVIKKQTPFTISQKEVLLNLKLI